MAAMTAILEQVVSKKLGAAMTAMMLIVYAAPDHVTQYLIAVLTALLVVCQTVLDFKEGRTKNGNGNGGQP